MKKITIKSLFLCLFLYSFLGLAQTTEEEYVNAENIRIEQAEANEVDVESFISTNLTNYVLTQGRIDQITSDLAREGITKQIEIDETLLNVKIEELRALYFVTYPQNESMYTALPIPVELQQLCVNGGFNNNNIAGYTFRSEIPNVFNACLTVPANTATPAPPTNNFIARTSRISSINGGYQANDPTLLALGIPIPTILTGNGSIKLNNMVANNVTNLTTMRRVFPIINEGFLDFNFSLILENPGGHFNNQPFFSVRVLDVNGNVVDNICIVSNPANCLFNSVMQANGTPLLYTGWVCARLNVQSILGQQGTVEFTISDCGFGGHEGVVYIDNVCGATCTNPAFGSINLNPLNINCPTTPFQVCGTYQTPPNSTLGPLTLNIMQGTTVIATINAPTQLTTNTYCFTIDPNLFGLNPTGNYTFQVNVTYNVNCPLSVFQYNSSNTNGNISFVNCCLPNLTLVSMGDNMNNNSANNISLRERANWIKASNVISIGNNNLNDGVVYHAGNFVELTPGFMSVNGSQFAAYIQGCTTPQSFIYKQQNQDSTAGISIDETKEINLIRISSGFTIHPNPSNSFIDLNIKNDVFNKITIVTIDGKLVLDKAVESTNIYNLDISRYASGIYIVNVISNSGKQYSQKVIKN